jgi:hypothetical protein
MRQHRIVRLHERSLDLFGQWATRWRGIRTSNAYAIYNPAARTESDEKGEAFCFV